ncbi:MAG: HAMP domain-containing histidine kinase [Comamonadaceae bacterium]|nr:MAG: HAMP domain-containing histidine kinase [Comamonadaceae bacterium]
MDVTRFDIACADGQWEERWWAPDNVPVPGTDGQVRAILHHVRDVTAQVQADRAVQAAEQRAANVRVQAAAELEAESRRQELFIATLSHELRNPLAPVRTGLHILRLGGSESPAGSRALQTMDRQLAHLVHLLDDLLDVSRINHGQVQLRLERLLLRQLLDQALEAAAPSLQGHRFAADLRVQDAAVEGDRIRLLQVVDNLLHNAAKYTPLGGSIRLEARVEGGQAVVRVQDDGIGIEPGHLARVFEPFTQLGTPCSDPSRGGLGIGLSIARQLVQMHHGSLDADSAGPGRGSTFTLRLPLAPS